MEATFCRYWSDMEGSQDVTVRHLTCLKEQLQAHNLKAEHCKKVKRNTERLYGRFPIF